MIIDFIIANETQVVAIVAFAVGFLAGRITKIELPIWVRRHDKAKKHSKKD